MNMPELATALGRAALARRLGVVVTAVNNAVARGKFPCSWYLVVNAMAAERGLECSDEMFSMVPPNASKREAVDAR